MNPRFLSACLIFSLLTAAVAWQTAAAQPGDTQASPARPSLSSEEVVANMVRRNLERAQALQAYEGTRTYHLEYRGFPSSRTAEMALEIKYRAPATKEFTIRSESGSRLLIDRVLHKLLQSEKEAMSADNQARVALTNDNYHFALAGYETLPSGPAFILTVEPQTSNKLLYRGRIWVDAEDFAVVRIEATPAKNPSFWTKDTQIEQAYAKVGDFWLPLVNRSSSTIRLGGHAYLTIEYNGYHITSATPLNPTARIAKYR